MGNLASGLRVEVRAAEVIGKVNYPVLFKKLFENPQQEVRSCHQIACSEPVREAVAFGEQLPSWGVVVLSPARGPVQRS